MVKVSKKGDGVTLYITMSIFPCGNAKTTSNLTLSCSDSRYKFKTTMSEKGLEKLRNSLLEIYASEMKAPNQAL